MRRVIGRLFVCLAIVLPVSVLLMSAAQAQFSAAGPAVLKCHHWKDDMLLNPGVSSAPSNQTIQAHGRLYGCNKAGGGAQFQGAFRMRGATCANLALSGSATLDWANGSHSTAFLVFQPQAFEPNKVFVNGTITSGMFDGLTIQAWLRFTQVFHGAGAPCSSGNPLDKIKFTNSQSLQLLTPQTSTTTVPPPTSVPPSTGPPTTSPITNPGTTVPITDQGSVPPPVTIFFPQCCATVVVPVRVPLRGTLAFTGSSSRTAALFGLEALLIGAALACLDPDRKERRLLHRAAGQRRSKRWLRVTLPPPPR